jgi:hypothetical protein
MMTTNRSGNDHFTPRYNEINASSRPMMYAAAMVPRTLPRPPKIATIRAFNSGRSPEFGDTKNTEASRTPATPASADDTPIVRL